MSGVGRIELCKNYPSGGLTPDLSDFRKVKKEVFIPLFVMIRPREGNFIYNLREINNMTDSIKLFTELGASGFVFGSLQEEQKLDVRVCKRLVNAARFLPCTLHRAFDHIENKKEGLKQAIDCGFSRILTAGGMGNCSENIEAISRLAEIAKNDITIIAGGGIRSSNIYEIVKVENLYEFHSSAIVNKKLRLPDSEEIDKLIRKISGP
jgi:copper homeostasis protein